MNMYIRLKIRKFSLILKALMIEKKVAYENGKETKYYSDYKKFARFHSQCKIL